jgi:acetyl-CoA carboxylase biotin carboxyl carrier protein
MNAPERDISFAEVDEVLRIIDQFPAAEIVYERGDLKLHVRRAGATPMAPVAAPAPAYAPVSPEASFAEVPAATKPTSAPVQMAQDHPGATPIESPLMGVFYSAPAPGAEPFVQPGQHVEAGDELCIIEVMKVMNLIKAHTAGVVVHIGAENGAMVERGQALIWIRPSEAKE